MLLYTKKSLRNKKRCRESKLRSSELGGSQTSSIFGGSRKRMRGDETNDKNEEESVKENLSNRLIEYYTEEATVRKVKTGLPHPDALFHELYHNEADCQGECFRRQELKE